MKASVFSPEFLGLFLPAVIVAYTIVPKRARWIVLLIAGFVLFWLISTKLLLFALAASATVYIGARAIGHFADRRDEALRADDCDKRAVKRRFECRANAVMVAVLLVDFGMLAAFKYLAFFGKTAVSLLALLGTDVTITLPAFVAPIGISFYTLMAASYLIDVRRGTVHADRNFGRVALFVTNFMTLIEGPICRYTEVIGQLTEGASVTRANLFAGAMRIAWGVAKKMIVADRVNAFVKPVFDNYGAYDGGIIALAAVLYTLQLYCDFSGAIDVALGSGRIFGIRLPENFRQPFFSKSASEFWTRWHITLGTWLRDYIYYPITLSRPMKALARKARKRMGSFAGPLLASGVSLLAVWFANGLWHGAASQYIFFGLYYFAIILAGRTAEPAVAKAAKRLGVNREGRPYRAFQLVRTLVVIVVGELIFRASGLQAGLAMLWRMLPWNAAYGTTEGGILGVGAFDVSMSVSDFIVVGVFTAVLLVVGVLKERSTDVLERICAWRFPVRWTIFALLVFAIAIFGAYGPGYTTVDPIYAQF